MLDRIPDQITFDEKELTIVWKDGKECKYDLLHLRKMCPCAYCRGGHSVTAKRITHDIKTIKLYSVHKVGRYALTLRWSDGHDLGIYTVDSLRNACEKGMPYNPDQEETGKPAS